MGLVLVFVWGGGNGGEGLISVFRQFSASIGEASILPAGLGAGLSLYVIVWDLDTFLIFPNFLRS